ncbi:hypothetical protein [Lewinella sp. JB7]|uniref:hypothetical protein n=1 Tax=Lewinella sp. JB7 TaxID=2962887 RepID=UPI0020C99782|nr:hypothetical protein [Lewinella sp. JB7]MCP9234793.1 hypothetical protein [Lewinella sp. JB7]
MPEHTENDQIFIRLLRSQLGQEWTLAKAHILAQLPEHVDPAELGKYVDESAEPGIHINAWGVEPRFYAHRNSRRLLEFYQIRSLKY